MGEGTGDQLQPGRRHIIERPRLTRLLDGATARVLMLVAPAGYGKTTLAQQWLRDKPSGWYRGSPASGDVAALGIGLAEAACAIVPGAGDRLRQRLRASNDPEAEVDVLAELLGEELTPWPDDAWLAFDDYHFAAESPAAEEFVDRLLAESRLRLLLTSRSRPRWATARRLLYGELHELGKSTLAMDESEADAVLASSGNSRAAGLIALADGWPAVIGLAALAEDSTPPDAEIPSALFDYFAQELYDTLEPEARSALLPIAISPALSRDDLVELVGPQLAAQLLETDAGAAFFATVGDGRVTLHPLLSAFLEQKLRQTGEKTARSAASVVASLLIARQRWDEAFAVIQEFDVYALVVDLIDKALDAALVDGRLATLAKWLDYARTADLSAPVLALAQAELASRRGQHPEAESLAIKTLAGLPSYSPRSVQALLIAGRSAHLRSDDKTALEHYRRAEECASTVDEKIHAIKGQLLAALDLELDDCNEILNRLNEWCKKNPKLDFHTSHARIVTSLRHGHQLPIRALKQVEAIARSARHDDDPAGHCSMANLLATAFNIAGYYERGQQLVSYERSLARRFRLDFVEPYASAVAVPAVIGLRSYAEASRLIHAVSQAGVSKADPYLAAEVVVLAARLHAVRGRHREALAILDESEEGVAYAAQEGEARAWRGLVLACLGRPADAEVELCAAERVTRSIEVQTLVPIGRAIAQTGSDTAAEAARAAFENALNRGGADSLVCGYRAHPPLLGALAQTDLKPRLRPILLRAHDEHLVRQLDLGDARETQPSRLHGLTPRELEVYGLLGQGLTNRQIAERLVVSEVTAKLHVRRVLEKVGVRTRTQAALRAASDLGG